MVFLIPVDGFGETLVAVDVEGFVTALAAGGVYEGFTGIVAVFLTVVDGFGVTLVAVDVDVVDFFLTLLVAGSVFTALEVDAGALVAP